MIRFENIELLYAFAVIPLLLIVYIIFRTTRRKMLKRIGERELINRLFPETSSTKSIFKFFLMIFAVSFVIIAMANPQLGTRLEEVKREGIEVIIAVDVSNSMLAEDVRPNRLERAKRSINRLLDNLVEDKIGLIVFAGKSYLQLPLTTDFAAARLIVSTISTDMVGTQGTAIGSAIDLALEAFSEDVTKSRALIIMTDGENHEDDAIGAAKRAKEQNIVIYTIGVGNTEGAPIPIYQGNRIVGYMKDKQGENVITRLDAAVLQAIALETGGEFFRSDIGTDVELTELVERVSKMDKQEFESKIFTNYESRFQIFIAIAMFFLILELIFSDKRNKFLAMLNNFVSGKK
jgi:Ca-activated chloride channel family protein